MADRNLFVMNMCMYLYVISAVVTGETGENELLCQKTCNCDVETVQECSVLTYVPKPHQFGFNVSLLQLHFNPISMIHEFDFQGYVW